MMRKFYILILILLSFYLSSCNTNINSSVYISSVGFDVNEDKLVAYFLSNPLTDITRSSEDKEKEAQFIKIETDSDVIWNVDGDKSEYKNIEVNVLKKKICMFVGD